MRFAIARNNSGGTHVKVADDGVGPQTIACTLDSFDLPPVDFLKIDCEGYEYFILKGAERTVRRDRPCIIVEQKPRKGSMYGLERPRGPSSSCNHGVAELKFEISGDFCLVW